MRRILIALAFTCLLAAPCAHAEDDNARLDRLERDMQYMQKQVYHGDGTANSGATPANGGSVEVRLGQLDQEIRQLRGAIEQNQFAHRQLAADYKKLSDDVEFRLHALEEKQTAQGAAPAVLAMPTGAEPAPAAAPAPTAAVIEDTPAQYDPAKGDDKKAAAAKKPALTGNDFPDANAHYSHAFKLLNEKKYADAASSFDAFVKKYPTDPLASNAYYWLGESYYARADYTRAAESFRKGFESNPSAQKAPDNLFKLGKSLEQVKRTSEACIVFGQISKKYADVAPRTAKLADDERTAQQCK